MTDQTLRSVSKVLGWVVFLGAVFPMLGYATGMSFLYTRPGGSPMAFVTACCFFLISLNMILHGMTTCPSCNTRSLVGKDHDFTGNRPGPA